MANLRWFVLIVALVALAGCTITDQNPPVDTGDNPSGQETAAVVQIIDGDTIDVRMNGDVYRVRYIGVNTPERDEPCYSDATAANRSLVQGQTVTLVRDVSETDRYGRLLRYVYVGNLFVNAELVAQGWAEARDYPPDTANSAYFHQLADNARASNLGCYPSGIFG